MSKSNKRAKEELIRLYGAECFIDKLHLRPDNSPRKYKGKAQYHRMKQLTYHHIKEKHLGGKATVENGAILSAENHEWFNKQPKEKQEEMNQKFQEYKKAAKRNDFCIIAAQINTKGIEKVEILEMEEPEEIIEIPVYDNNPEEYEKYLTARRKKEFAKFGKEYKPPINPASIDIKEQNEFHKEIIDEIRY